MRLTAALNGVLPWLFLKPSLEPPGPLRKGGFCGLHKNNIVVVVFALSLDTESVISEVTIIPSICHFMPFQKGFACFCVESPNSAVGISGADTMA